MVSELSAAINAQDDFDDGMRKLGWLSAYTRQALIVRYLLRNIGDLDEVPIGYTNRYPLDCFRVAISVLSGVNQGSGNFSSPYHPEYRPDTHFLAFTRQNRIFDVSSATGLPSFNFHLPSGGIFGFENSNYSVADKILLHEVHSVAKGVSLATKHIGDERILQLRNEPLWRGMDSTEKTQALQFIELWAAVKPTLWAFWRDWYQGLVEGKPIDWNLQRTIAQIDDAIWRDGPEAIATEIERIRTQFKTQFGPSLRKNDNSKWEIEPDVEIDQEPLSFAIAQVEVTLAAALTGNANNGLTDTSHETVLIRGACNSYREMPSVVATSFWNACMSLERNIGDVYPEDPALLVLKNVLYTSVEELCAQDNLIRDRVAKLAALETRRYPTQQEREDLKLVPQEVADEMTQPALDILQSDIDIVVATDKPPRANRARLVNWLTKIGSGIDKTQRNEKRVSWLLKLSGRIAGWFFDGGNEAE